MSRQGYIPPVKSDTIFLIPGAGTTSSQLEQRRQTLEDGGFKVIVHSRGEKSSLHEVREVLKSGGRVLTFADLTPHSVNPSSETAFVMGYIRALERKHPRQVVMSGFNSCKESLLERVAMHNGILKDVPAHLKDCFGRQLDKDGFGVEGFGGKYNLMLECGITSSGGELFAGLDEALLHITSLQKILTTKEIVGHKEEKSLDQPRDLVIYDAGPSVFEHNADKHAAHFGKAMSHALRYGSHRRGVPFLDTQAHYQYPTDTNVPDTVKFPEGYPPYIEDINMKMIENCARGKVGVIIADLTCFRDKQVDDGTAFEIGAATAFSDLGANIRIIGYHNDRKQQSRDFAVASPKFEQTDGSLPRIIQQSLYGMMVFSSREAAADGIFGSFAVREAFKPPRIAASMQVSGQQNSILKM